MLLKKNNIEIFFVHIPRTAGRYVTNLLKSNNFQPISLDTRENYNGIEEIHLHHKLLNHFDEYNRSKKLTIVRDPLNKFVSSATIDIGLHKRNSNLEFNSVENIISYINLQKNKYSFHTNWFRPQHEFISKDCKIWKYENGFKDDFIKFLKKNFNIEINICEVDWKTNYDDVYKKINITDKIKETIKSIYKEDYNLFDYK